MAVTQSGNYREPFSESDIKSAVVDSIGQRNSYVKTWGCGGFLNETNIYSRVVDSIGQRNSYVKTWGCGGFLNETNIYSRGKSLCF
ncbi:hypothetical protein EAI63_27530 [Escherichia coli]|nr:hypothetical protein EAI63_27530 [Escherichia coli]